ncbi:MAG: polyprenyl diphosphate synthase [Bdellovibrionales bacterium]|nr:polyprenyl diphosphate synthase [Bdellovibrionales bacterium]
MKKKEARPAPLPLQHLAVIMDGNGRWAEKKGWPRYFGHFRGVKSLRQMVKSCSRWGIPYLTVFAFSTENWKRSSIEVSVIMKLMSRSLTRYQQELDRNQIRLHVLGNLEELAPSVRNIFNEMVERTKNNTGLKLIVAVNYGGRQEIIQAVRAISRAVKEGQMEIDNITEDHFYSYMSSSVFPPPDLIIRTGAVSRLSNFYLWTAAYSEIYVSDVLWPDFNEAELKKALHFYTQTSRRFGAASLERK